jgi:hypothetical protein
MVNVPLPQELSQPISEKAAQYAREDIRSMGWSNKSIDAVSAYPGEGIVGLQLSEKYLVPQSKGFDPFLMHWVEGRVVPLNDKKSGKTYYRFGRGVGQPGYVTLPGGVKKWRDQKWRHPGLPPKNFLEKAITRAISENKPVIRQHILAMLKGDE